MSLPDWRWGYLCENRTLGATTLRTLRLGNLTAERARDKVQANLADLERMVRFNAEHCIGVLRVGQQLVPFGSHPAFPYDWAEEHGAAMRQIGVLAAGLSICLTMHPGQFVQPGSTDPGVVERSLAELRYSARVLSLLNPGDGVMVLHGPAPGGDREAAAERFIAALAGETEVLRYLALENDERWWSVRELLPVAERLGVPVVADTLHHGWNDGGWTLREALEAASPTWGGRRQKVHLSSQAEGGRPGAHAELVDPADLEQLLAAGSHLRLDVMVEAKAKELAVLPLVGETARRAGVR
ncbi:UV DNA damage repair endonuclease UvsE [Tepidiforma sp.]|uniref:UV DNA damage repair endonuclease UvsE n=1 Tax=Tepidiforma sp. TaxID=2682230 RepID=UPI002ADD932F|nr:UV DNA damage repair endonuclease UvsE [Tepidiforma sp.]